MALTQARTPEEVYGWLVRQLQTGPAVSRQRNVLDVSYLAERLAYTTNWDPFAIGVRHSTTGVIRAACRRLVREGVLDRVGYGRYRRHA